MALLCDGSILTYLRDDKVGIPFPGFWDLPGGGREGSESPVECALRELEEEFALRLPAGRIEWGALLSIERPVSSGCILFWRDHPT